MKKKIGPTDVKVFRKNPDNPAEMTVHCPKHGDLIGRPSLGWAPTEDTGQAEKLMREHADCKPGGEGNAEGEVEDVSAAPAAPKRKRRR